MKYYKDFNLWTKAKFCSAFLNKWQPSYMLSVNFIMISKCQSLSQHNKVSISPLMWLIPCIWGWLLAGKLWYSLSAFCKIKGIGLTMYIIYWTDTSLKKKSSFGGWNVLPAAAGPLGGSVLERGSCSSAGEGGCCAGASASSWCRAAGGLGGSAGVPGWVSWHWKQDNSKSPSFLQKEAGFW